MNPREKGRLPSILKPSSLAGFLSGRPLFLLFADLAVVQGFGGVPEYIRIEGFRIWRQTSESRST